MTCRKLCKTLTGQDIDPSIQDIETAMVMIDHRRSDQISIYHLCVGDGK